MRLRSEPLPRPLRPAPTPPRPPAASRQLAPTLQGLGSSMDRRRGAPFPEGATRVRRAIRPRRATDHPRYRAILELAASPARAAEAARLRYVTDGMPGIGR